MDLPGIINHVRPLRQGRFTESQWRALLTEPAASTDVRHRRRRGRLLRCAAAAAGGATLRSHEDRQEKLTHLLWHLSLFSSMSVCGLIKTWLPNERSPLKPAECLVLLRRRGCGHTGPLFLLPTERCSIKLSWSGRPAGSHINTFYMTVNWNVNKRQNAFCGSRYQLIRSLFISPCCCRIWETSYFVVDFSCF